MASLQTIATGGFGFLYPTPPLDTLAMGTIQLNANTDRVASIFKVPKTGTISKIGFKIAAVVDGTTDMSVALQTVSLATGDPTGTDYGGSAAGTLLEASVAAGNKTVSLATPATAVRGDLVAAVISIAATGDLTINTAATHAAPWTAHFPYTSNNLTGSYAKASGFPVVWIEYSDGTYCEIPGVYPWQGGAESTHTYNTGSAKDEFALRFKLPFPCRVNGWWGFVSSAAAGDFNAVLYSGTTELASVSMDGDVHFGTAASMMMMPFPSPVTLVANQVYRLGIRAMTGNNVNMRRHTADTAAVMAAMSGGAEFYQSSRDAGGGWAADDTLIRPMLGLAIDQVLG